MRHKTQKGIFFLIISAIFLLISFKPVITGGVVGLSSEFSYSYIISIVFFLASVLIFTSRQTLDAIMIPTGDYEADKQRTDRAIQEDKDAKEGHPEKSHQVYLISGRIDKPIKTSQVNEIYKRLRSYGIKPKNIRIEGKSKNTLENVLFSLEKLKKMGAHDVGIASYPLHLDRFEDLIKEAKKEGIIYKNFRVHRLETPEDLKQKLYGIIHRAIYRYELERGGFEAVGKSKLRFLKKEATKVINKLLPK